MMQAFDCAVRVPASPAQQAGYVGAFRYLYSLTGYEVADLHDHGLWVSLIAEFDTATWHPVAQAPEMGLPHGQTAARQAAQLGAPAGTVAWATADTYVGPGAYPMVARYLDGFRQGLGAYRPGIYGGAALVKAMLTAGHADFGWVAGADSWNGGLPADQAGAVAHQLPRQSAIAGITVDVNDIYQPGTWAWYPQGAEPPPDPTPQPEPVPVPQPTPEDSDMPTPFKFKDDDRLFYVVGDKAVHIPGPNALSVMLTTKVVAPYVQTDPSQPAANGDAAEYVNGDVITAIKHEFGIAD